MTDWNNLIQQSITASEQSKVSHVEQSIHLAQPQQLIYFDLEVVVDTPHGTLSTWTFPPDREKLQTIKPGNYQVRVWASRDSYSGQYLKQRGLEITSDIELQLLCDQSSEVKIDYQSCPVPVESVSSFEHIFHIAITEECADVEATFALVYYDGNTWPKPVTSLKIKLDGIYRNIREKCKIELDTPLPEQTAILHIQKTPDDENKLSLRGWSHRDGTLQTDPIDRIAISLADFVERKEKPEKVIKTLRKFSRNSPAELRDWLKRLLKRYGEQLCLIIVDHTDFETPWEMLEVEEEERYLGAHATVVRWTLVRYPANRYISDIWHTLKMSPQQPHSSVLAYLDDKELGEQQTYAERTVLEELQVRHCVNLKELLLQLSDGESLKDIGLIYLGCHGYQGTSIGSQHNLSERTTDIDFEIPITHPHPRPIVFVNACDSARLKHVSRSFFSGLVIVLLARFACGCIGTLGQVGSICASMIADKLLRAASTYPDGVRIAEILRQVREEAERKITSSEMLNLDRKEREEREKNFIYTFMYVYYGSGLTQLQLERKKRDQDEHE